MAMTVSGEEEDGQPDAAAGGPPPSRASDRPTRRLRVAAPRALRSCQRIACWTVFVLLLTVTFLLPRGDRRILSVAEGAVVTQRYALVSWEVGNFPAKWLHRIYTVLPWSDTSLEERRADLNEYLALVERLRQARAALDRSSALSAPDVAAKQAAVDTLLRERDRLRTSVEEYLESVISAVVDEQGLGAPGDFLWPPVDFRLDQPPRVLITSPRDRIERMETVLVSAAVSVREMELAETRLLEKDGLSAVIEPTGGLATYPTVIGHDSDLLPLLEVAAHEWLHSYLFFHPLGQNYDRSDLLTQLNETLADMAGREIGGLAYTKLTGKAAPPIERPADPLAAPPPVPGVFSFSRFMRETRLRTDELLASGEIAGAEAYMEARRVELNTHGYAVRKINQAYFAFHGSYGESPASVSPVAGELFDLRLLAGSPGQLVKLVRGASSYEEFRAVLDRERQ